MPAKILVVEDDSSLRAVIRLVLEQADYEVAEASNGRAALDGLGSDVPDLIIADAKMPFLTGAELIERLRADAAHSSIPVVLMTGLPDSLPDLVRPDAVVAKPFDKDDLLELIGRLLGQSSADGSAGSSSRNTLPLPGSLSAVTSPPSSRAASRLR